MSSTNRSRARESHVSDYYVTPVKDIKTFIKAMIKDNLSGIFNQKYKILDPCAGGDEKHPMSYPDALRRMNFKGQIDTMDIREDSRAEIIGNYLETDVKSKYNVIITNPPFNLALPIIEKALDDVAPGGYVIMLLLLNFFGSQKRKEFFQKNMPTYCFVHSKRLKFLDTGGTDSSEYMHAIWFKDSNPRYTQLRVI
jgi:hypothetical protein